MKNPLLKLTFAALSALFLLASCDTYDPAHPASKDLELAMREFTLTCLPGQAYAYKLEVISGNGDYEVTVDDESVLTAGQGDGDESGKIVITPVKFGKTGITVVDRTTGQDARVEVSVVCAYLNFSFTYERIFVEIDDPELKAEIEKKVPGMSAPDGYCYSLVNDEENTLFIYKSYSDYCNGKYSAKGTYGFEIGEDTGGCAKFTLSNAGNMNPAILYLANVSVSNILKKFFDAKSVIPEGETRSSFPGNSYSWVQDFKETLITDYPSLEACVVYYHMYSSALDTPVVAPYLTNTPLAE